MSYSDICDDCCNLGDACVEHEDRVPQPAPPHDYRVHVGIGGNAFIFLGKGRRPEQGEKLYMLDDATVTVEAGRVEIGIAGPVQDASPWR